MAPLDLLFTIRDTADKHNIDRAFLLALVHCESRFNPDAVRYEVDYPWAYNVTEIAKDLKITPRTVKAIQSFSYGLCQIMGAVAFEYGFSGELRKLFDPQLNLNLGCLHINKMKEKYSTPLDIYAAYNAGSVRIADGRYVNQSNVTSFRNSLEYVSRCYSVII